MSATLRFSASGGSEEWRSWPRASGLVEVSSLGRARRTADGKLYKTKGSRYPQLRAMADGIIVVASLHIAVLETFVGPRPKGCQGAHLNGNRSDARLENLAWVTPKENAAHKYAHGTILFGSRCPTAKLTETEVRSIRKDRDHASVVAAKYGITAEHVGRLRRGGRWAHLSGEPDDFRGPRRGVESPHAVLTDGVVREIRARVQAGEPQIGVARDLGVSRVTLNHVVHRRTWRHVQ